MQETFAHGILHFPSHLTYNQVTNEEFSNPNIQNLRFYPKTNREFTSARDEREVSGIEAERTG